MTYIAVRALGSTPEAVEHAIRSRLDSGAASVSSPTLLEQYGRLLATAPLRRATRIAVIAAIAAIPNLRNCGIRTDLLNRRGIDICARASGEQTDILVNPRNGMVFAIENSLRAISPAFPGLPSGSITEQQSFHD